MSYLVKGMIAGLFLIALTGCSSSMKNKESRSDIVYIVVAPDALLLEHIPLPIRNDNTVSSLGSAYAEAIGSLHQCNARLDSIKELKDSYKEL